MSSKKAVHDLNKEDSACSAKENKPDLVLLGDHWRNINTVYFALKRLLSSCVECVLEGDSTRKGDFN